MRFGLCSNLQTAGAPDVTSFDFLELVATEVLVPLAGEEEFEKIFQRVRELPRPVEALNCFVPRSVRITGPDVNTTLLERFAEASLRRAERIGVKVIVFGSGGARKVPDGFPYDKARSQIIDFLKILAGFAGKVVIAIEPLNRDECNIISSVSEALDIAAEVDNKAVRVLADSYHMWKEGEVPSVIEQAGDKLVHVHLSARDRKAPDVKDAALSDFFRHLHSSGFDGRISFECVWQERNIQAPKILEAVKEQWKKTAMRK